MKFFKNQNGFTALEIILILIVLGVVGFAGFRYYQAHQTKPAPTTSTSTTATTAKPKPADPYAGWKTYTDAVYSFKYPADWTFSVKQDDNFGHVATIDAPVTGRQRVEITVAGSLAGDYCLGVHETTSNIAISFDGVSSTRKLITCGEESVIFFPYSKAGNSYVVFAAGNSTDFKSDQTDIVKLLNSFRIK